MYTVRFILLIIEWIDPLSENKIMGKTVKALITIAYYEFEELSHRLNLSLSKFDWNSSEQMELE